MLDWVERALRQKMLPLYARGKAVPLIIVFPFGIQEIALLRGGLASFKPVMRIEALMLLLHQPLGSPEVSSAVSVIHCLPDLLAIWM